MLFRFLYNDIHMYFRSQKIETLQYQVTQGGGPLAEQLSSGNITLFNNPQRPPTLSECEAVIRHLQHVNEQQKHEVGDRLLSF